MEDPLNLAASLEKDLCGDERSSISAGLASSGIILGSSAPVNIPGSSHVSATVSSNAHLFSSPGSSPIFLVGDGGSRFSHHDCLSSVSIILYILVHVHSFYLSSIERCKAYLNQNPIHSKIIYYIIILIFFFIFFFSSQLILILVSNRGKV